MHTKKKKKIKIKRLAQEYCDNPLSFFILKKCKEIRKIEIHNNNPDVYLHKKYS